MRPGPAAAFNAAAKSPDRCTAPGGAESSMRAGKAAAGAAAVEGPLSASCPASVLQLHPHATVLVDEAAASGLTRADYYREVFAGKPDWQGL